MSCSSNNIPIIQTFLERFQIGKFKEFWRNPLRTGIANITKLLGQEMTTEYLQSYPDSLTDLIARAEKAGSLPEQINYIVENVPRALWEANVEGVRDALVVAPWAMVGGGSKITIDTAKAYLANRQMAHFEKAMELASRIAE